MKKNPPPQNQPKLKAPAFPQIPKAEVEAHWMPFGRVLGAHGIRGGLKIKTDNPASDFLQIGTQLGIQLPSGNLALMTIISLAGGGRFFFVGLETRNDAETWASKRIWVRREDLPEADEDEVYLADLLGARLEDTAGVFLGEISGFSDNRAQTLIVVKTPEGKEALLPFVPPIVREIREKEGLVILDPPTGWADD